MNFSDEYILCEMMEDVAVWWHRYVTVVMIILLGVMCNECMAIFTPAKGNRWRQQTLDEFHFILRARPRVHRVRA